MDPLEKKRFDVAKQLLFGCKRTAEEEVTIQLSHATMVLGTDKVEKIVLKKNELQTKRRVRRKIRRGNVGYGTFNRIELIDALETSGVLDEGTIGMVPEKRFAAGRLRSTSTVVRDAWAD